VKSGVWGDLRPGRPWVKCLHNKKIVFL